MPVEPEGVELEARVALLQSVQLLEDLRTLGTGAPAALATGAAAWALSLSSASRSGPERERALESPPEHEPDRRAASARDESLETKSGAGEHFTCRVPFAQHLKSFTIVKVVG